MHSKLAEEIAGHLHRNYGLQLDDHRSRVLKEEIDNLIQAQIPDGPPPEAPKDSAPSTNGDPSTVDSLACQQKGPDTDAA